MELKKRLFAIPLIIGAIFINGVSFESVVVKAEESSTLPFEDYETPDNKADQQYGQTKGDANKSVENIVGKNNKENIIDMEGVQSLRTKAFKFMNVIIALIFGFAVIMVVFAGFKIVMSEGNERNTRDAKFQIIAAGIGIGVAVFAKVILQLFQQVLSITG